MRWLADAQAKRAVERWWLLYTPVWGLATGAVMLTGWAESWGDGSCMVFGVLVAAGAALPPLLRVPESERALPFRKRTAPKYVLSVVLFAFGLNYTQTPFFFDVLHMHYGFDVTWTLDRNPLFLYLVTVAYFATYAVLCAMAFRALRPKTSLAWVIAPLAVAFLETALNANPFMKGLFCYDDLGLALGFGTLTYGFSFVVALPMWMAIDERPGDRLPLRMVFVYGAAALFADWLFLEVVRHGVAPFVTTVVDDAPGLRDFATSCLER